jgi:hypothetical protein
LLTSLCLYQTAYKLSHMKILGTNIKDEYVWIGGALLGAAGLYWFSMANGRPGIQLTGADTRRAYPAMACSNGHCIESDDDNVGIQCVNGVCTKTDGSSGSMTQTSEDGSTMTSTDPQVAQDMIDQINRRIRRQQREITDEATGNFARAYQSEVGGGGMGGGAGGANGLGDINNDFMAQLEAMIQRAVAEGMANSGGQDGVGATGANANGLPGLDGASMAGADGHPGHGGGMGGAGGHGGGGGHSWGGGGGGHGGGMGGAGGGRRKKRGGAGGGGMGGKKKGGMGGAGGHGGGMGGHGAGKTKGAGASPPDCTDPNNAALPECANAQTSATDSGFAMAYAGTMNNYAYQGDADDIDEYYDSYRGSMEEMDEPDENDLLKLSYNTGNTFELNMPTNPMSSTVYGNTRYDQMSPFKVVSA